MENDKNKESLLKTVESLRSSMGLLGNDIKIVQAEVEPLVEEKDHEMLAEFKSELSKINASDINGVMALREKYLEKIKRQSL